MKLFGYSEQEVSGLTFEKIFPKNEHEKHYGLMQQSLETGKTNFLETFVLTKDRKEIPVLLSSTELKGSTGKPTGFIDVCDILKK